MKYFHKILLPKSFYKSYKFSDKIYYNYRDNEFFLRDCFFL